MKVSSIKLLFLTGVFVLFHVSPTSSACAAAVPSESTEQPVATNIPANENNEKSVLQFLKGEPTKDGIYLGMWSYHFIDDSETYRTTHNLIGLAYKGFYAGTFENSRSERAWSVGLQRDVYNTTLSIFSVDSGYRVGLLHGYEKMQLFDTGFFPFLQLYCNLTYKGAGFQFSWAGSALTFGFLYNF